MDFDYHGGEIKEKIKYDFSVNLNPLGMPACVKKVIADNPSCFTDYPDRYCKKLRELLAQKEKIADRQILCGNGASELIMVFCAWLAKERPGFTAAVMEPAFSGYERAVRAYGGKVRYYRNEKELLELFQKETLPDVIFVCNPNNPTGETIDHTVLVELFEMAGKRQTRILLDECFIDFTQEESCIQKIYRYTNVFVLKAFTKFYGMAGVRLGYLCADEKYIKDISAFLPEWNVSGAAQAAGIAILNEYMEDDIWKKMTWDLLEFERDYMICEFQKMGFGVSASKANFLLLKSPVAHLWEELAIRNILVRDCRNFRTLNESYIRVCISTHEKNELLLTTTRRIMSGKNEKVEKRNG